MRRMKDSGIAWLGEVPAEWECTKLKYLVVKSNGGAWGEDSPDNKSGAICLRVADFDYQRGRFRPCDKKELTHRIYDEAHFARLALQKGDIIIEKSGGGAKTPVGRAVLYDGEWGPVAYSNFTQRLRFDASKVTPQFIAYWLRTWYAHRLSPFYIKQTTGIQNLNVPLMLAKERIFLPPLPEQETIARYLDEKTAKIDRLLDARRKEVSALKELKQAVVARAVTCGLKPGASMKDSGIAWIREVPEHWEVVRLMSLFRENKTKNADFAEQRAFKFYYGTLVPKPEYKLTPDLIDTYKKYTVVAPGDIVINGLNLNYDFVSQRVALVREKGIITSAYLILRPSGEISPDFYNYCFKAVDAQKIFNGLGKGIRLTLSYNIMKHFLLPLPPREEQDAIARYLDEKTAKIDKIAAAYTKEISLLEELKAAVIADGVRGRIRA